MIIRLLGGLLLLVSLRAQSPAAEPFRCGDPGPGSGLKLGLGVNIHFTDPRPGEMKMLAAAGFRWVRMDFNWGATEREKGRYDFSAYDRLLAALEPQQIRGLWILDYSNRFYDQGLSPASDEGRRAMARWAAAAVEHFRGHDILWEMYNEPNIQFWKPKPDVKQYVKLALEVGRAIRAAAPNEWYAGPGTSQIDLEFIEECCKAGLLQYWSAVTVHPYRQTAPETVTAEYARLRQLIRRYAPPGAAIPIISGEWGYSSAWRGVDQTRQGKMLPRQWLTNLVNRIPLSIWYDWHDDGTDPKDAEHHFGTVAHAYFPDREPVYDSKPAYLAARALTQALKGFFYSKRLDVGRDEDYVLLFGNPADEVRLLAWTTAATPHPVTIPASPGRFQATGHCGERFAPWTANAQGLRIIVSDAPQYLRPELPNDLLRVAAAWECMPPEIVVHAPVHASCVLMLRNPLEKPFRCRVGAGAAVDVGPHAWVSTSYWYTAARGENQDPLRIELSVEGLGRVAQRVPVVVDNPLRLMLLPLAAASAMVRIENPSGEPLRGAVALTDLDRPLPRAKKTPVELAAGQTEKTVALALDQPPGPHYRFSLSLDDEQGVPQVQLPPAACSRVDDFSHYTAESLPRSYRLAPEGDRQVASSQAMAVAAPPEGPPAAGAGCLKISYHFDAGWKFVCLMPQGAARERIEGRPTAFGLWVYGDGSGNRLRLRLADRTGQTFQVRGELLRWKGWRYVVFPLDSATLDHWGGANDGLPHYPLRWNTLLLIDSAGRRQTQGEIYLSGPTLIELETIVDK